jgi:hypothetical protein
MLYASDNSWLAVHAALGSFLVIIPKVVDMLVQVASVRHAALIRVFCRHCMLP